MSDISDPNPNPLEPSSDQKDKDFLVVGLGASAGGIGALKTFFANVPSDSNIAYVVILHLSPERESNLAEIIQMAASIPVTQVTEDALIEPNHVYVIPPNQSLSMIDGMLKLSEIKRIEDRRAPVDTFFRTLAESHDSNAACVVLSGTGANGSMGLKRIKEKGGLTIVQDPTEAEFADMPRNSIATDLVDFILPVAEMPAKIIAYRDHAKIVQLPKTTLEARPQSDEQALISIFTQLRMRTGHDFTNYKRATVLRRIERRMAVTETIDLPGYLQYMRANPEEPQALLKDLLISVTNFFRDPEAFTALERNIIPRVFEGKGPKDQVRVWVAGCATGEEAYSIAMLLIEYVENISQPPALQVFATDIDEQSIATARAGYYTLNDAADVSPERLRRFFIKEREGYRVRRDLREIVLFAHHNLIKDPPFSHLDMVSCRNLLIYLNRSLQEKAMETIHFAIRPRGYLFLGTSESTSGPPDLFMTVDKENHIYQSRAVAPRITALPFNIQTDISDLKVRPREETLQEIRAQERLSYLDLHQRLLEQYGPPSVLVNEDYDIVHLSETAGQFLQMTGGEPSHNLLRIVRPELRLELRTALYQSAQSKKNVEVQNLQVRVDSNLKTINIVVRPVTGDEDVARGFYLVLFEDAQLEAGASPQMEIIHSVEPAARQLEDELVRVKAQLRATIEQYEVQHEELRASNEELQAMNEELRSAAEELETSKEELQSVNEELTTVNQELKVKIEELSQSNNDFRNLMNSTDIGTIFLDRALRVKLFTPRARDLFNLIPADTGRSLFDLTNKLDYGKLTTDIERVLDKLQVVEREVKTQEEHWYLMRLLPYRTTEDRIDGVVITFTDMTERKLAEERLRRSEERLRLLIESVTDYALFALTTEGRIEYWNSGAERSFGYRESEILGQSADILFTPEDRREQVARAELIAARRDGRVVDERWHIRKDGSRFFVSGVMTPIMRDGNLRGFVKVLRDLTKQQHAAEQLQKAHDQLEVHVTERTKELSDAYEAMRVEAHDRKVAEDSSRELVRQLVNTQEDERRRISRDLHDQLGQQLTALRLRLESLKSNSAADKNLADQIDDLQKLVRGIDSEVDFLAWELRPIALDDLGLPAVLTNYGEEWSSHYKIPAQVHIAGMDSQRLWPQVETNLYRITQEALNNIYKYASAARVDVILERRENDVVLIIEDDGVGFNAGDGDGTDKGLGLAGMRERAALLGGTLEIESTPDKGTTIFVRIPNALRTSSNRGGGGDGQ